MSDSARVQYTSAEALVPTTTPTRPLHVNDAEPIKLDISGSLTSLLLTFPKHAEMTVGGDMVNSRFNVQNLHPTDSRPWAVGGNIVNRNEFTPAAADGRARFQRVRFASIRFSLPANFLAADLAALAKPVFFLRSAGRTC